MAKQVNDSNQPHLPVLYQEVIQYLSPAAPGKFVDGTVGAGGHAFGILSTFGSSNELLGIDLDPVALEHANVRLLSFGESVHLQQGSYADIADHLLRMGWLKVRGILLDLGVSSMQLDMPEKGFSFRADAPLDMRFNPSAPLTGAELLNGSDESRNFPNSLGVWRGKAGEAFGKSHRSKATCGNNQPIGIDHRENDRIPPRRYPPGNPDIPGYPDRSQ